MEAESRSERSGGIEPNPAAFSAARRELLRKAAWMVPVIIALPLTPLKGHAHGVAHASPNQTLRSFSGSDDIKKRSGSDDIKKRSGSDEDRRRRKGSD